MTGTDIIGFLLLGDAAVLGISPGAHIKEDRLPDDAALPAMLVRTVSSVDRQTLKRVGFVRKTDRVAVTVRARNVKERKAAIKAICSACAGKVGDFAGAFRVSVLTAGLGPSVNGPGNSFEQTQDFRVSYDDPI